MYRDPMTYPRISIECFQLPRKMRRESRIAALKFRFNGFSFESCWIVVGSLTAEVFLPRRGNQTLLRIPILASSLAAKTA